MPPIKPDLYIAAIGRSGSTMLCNMLTRAPSQIIFIEPKFHSPPYRGMLTPQLRQFGMDISPARQKTALGLAPQPMLAHVLGPALRSVKWGFKEVLCEEHHKVLALFAPDHILINTRDIFDVALSFMEKHRRQGNEDRFPPAWVRDYCQRESLGMVRFCQHLAQIGQPHTLVRYEDFTKDADFRVALAKSLGWTLGTQADRFLHGFNRGFEASRHQGRDFRAPTLAERGLPDALVQLARDIQADSAEYQQFFSYSPAKGRP